MAGRGCGGRCEIRWGGEAGGGGRQVLQKVAKDTKGKTQRQGLNRRKLRRVFRDKFSDFRLLRGGSAEVFWRVGKARERIRRARDGAAGGIGGGWILAVPRVFGFLRVVSLDRGRVVLACGGDEAGR